MGFEAGYAFLLGFVLGYLHYDMTHYFIHQTVPKSDMLKVRPSVEEARATFLIR